MKYFEIFQLEYSYHLVPMDSPFGHSPARLGNPAGNTSVSSVNLAGAPLEVVLGQYQNSLVAYETTHRQLHELVNKLQKKVKKTNYYTISCAHQHKPLARHIHVYGKDVRMQ